MSSNLSDRFACDQLFAGRHKPRVSPLGWDWVVARVELFCKPRPRPARLLAQAGAVLRMDAHYAGMDDAGLYAEMDALRHLFRLGRETEEDTLRALALVREAAYRVRGEKPYHCQVAGALGILQHCIVEMATGEGKTLTAGLAAVVAGWRGKGCHVVTANDYLAARDAALLHDFFTACFCVSASVTQSSSPQERRAAYAADITYLTSKEAAADFLRDQMALGACTAHTGLLARSLAGEPLPQLVQRGLFCAIVDEADSVLCDGGSTPLIISVPRDNAPSTQQYLTASLLADNMTLGRDYSVNRKFREASLSDAGRKKVLESLRGPGKAWARRSRALELTLQAVEARQFFEPAVQYVVHEGKVVIVDEATGRIMPDHEWRDGMHQAVSAKEGLEVVPPRATSAQTTFQDFFLRYRTLGGMTGTAWEARREFLQFYCLHVLRIPTHKACQRHRVYRAFHATRAEKFADMAASAAREHAAGRAVLLGTKSIGDSELVSQALTLAGVHHEVLNAVQHEREADIVAQAGREGVVTVATNMAGRGTDIKLSPAVRDSGGLHVILAELHNSARIDRQLYGRAGRQGDPGSVADIVSLEDDLFITAPVWLRRLMHMLRRAPRGRAAAQALLWKLAAWWQWTEDRRAFAMRRRMVRSNRQFADMISYSGKQT